MSELRHHEVPLPKTPGSAEGVQAYASKLSTEASNLEDISNTLDGLRDAMLTMTGPAVASAATRLGMLAARAARLSVATSESAGVLNTYGNSLQPLLTDAASRAETDLADHRIAARLKRELAENARESAQAQARGDVITVHRLDMEDHALERSLTGTIAEENRSYDGWLRTREEIELAAATAATGMARPAEGPGSIPLPLPAGSAGTPLGLAAGQRTAALLDEIAAGGYTGAELDAMLAEIEATKQIFGEDEAYWSAFLEDADATDAFLDFLVFASASGANPGVAALGRTLAVESRSHLGAWTSGLSAAQQEAIGRNIVHSAGGQRGGDRGAFAAFLLSDDLDNHLPYLPDGVVLGAAVELDEQLRVNHGLFVDDGGMARVAKFVEEPFDIRQKYGPGYFDIRTMVWTNLSMHPNAAYGFLIPEDEDLRNARQDFWFGYENADVTGVRADGGISLMGGLDAAIAAGSTGDAAAQERTALYMVDLTNILGADAGPTLFDGVLNDAAKDRLVLAYHPYAEEIGQTFAENKNAEHVYNEVLRGGGVVEAGEDGTGPIVVFDQEAMSRLIDVSSRGADGAGHVRWENLVLTHAREVGAESADLSPDERGHAFNQMLDDSAAIWGRVEGADIVAAQAADDFASQVLGNGATVGIGAFPLNPPAAMGVGFVTNEVLSALSPLYTNADEVFADAFHSNTAFARRLIGAYESAGVPDKDGVLGSDRGPIWEDDLARHIGDKDGEVYDEAVNRTRNAISGAIDQVQLGEDKN